MAGIQLVVSCAKRKTREPRASLRLRAVRRSLTVERRAREWVGRLSRFGSEQLPARDLYSGEHWHTVRSVLSLPHQSCQPVHVWVCSAGYGLVPIDTPVSPYSATFTPSDVDAVCGGPDLRTGLPTWWAAVARYGGVHSGPRTIADLARTHPDDFLLVALPATYLTAVADDLRDAAGATGSPDRFAVLSVGGSVADEVEPHLLPAEACLQRFAGGSLSSLNARLARTLIADLGEEPLTLSRCRRRLTALLKKVPVSPATSRTVLSDAELRAAIRGLLKDDPDASVSRLLRRLRDGGRACEQSRFVEHFRQVKGARDART